MRGIRALALFLALAMLLALCSCAKENPEESATDEANVTGNAGGAGGMTEEEDPWADRDITAVVEAWRGRGDTGKVKTPGEYAATLVRSLNDLAPYRSYFPQLSDEEAARITSDEEGIVAVLEIASADLSLIYSVDNVTREDGSIVFLISEMPEIHEPEYDENGNEVEFPAPGSPYEYFLFYIPAAEYQKEDLIFQFS